MSSTSASGTTGRPNILVLMTDQHRADCLGCYGHPLLKTPHLDGLAAEGVRFTRAYTAAPQCCPARISFITGRYPHTHRVRWNNVELPADEVTLPSLLREAGYRTAAVGKMHFTPPRFNPGFDEMLLAEERRLGEEDDYGRYLRQLGWHERPAAKDMERFRRDFTVGTSPLPEEQHDVAWVADRAIRFLEEQVATQAPFFLWASFIPPHTPLTPPEPYDRLYDPDEVPMPRRVAGELEQKPAPQGEKAYKQGFATASDETIRLNISHYYGLITLIDTHIGRIIERLGSLGLAKDTVVVFISDHGEMLGDHWQLRKGQYLYEGNTRIPLIFRLPDGDGAGRSLGHFANTVDVMPTLLDLAGLPAPQGVQGRSLLPLLRGEEVPWQDAVFSELGPDDRRVKMVRTADWKLVYYWPSGEGELYHLTDDPDEFNNLFARPVCGAVQRELERRLLDWMIETADTKPPIPAARAGREE